MADGRPLSVEERSCIGHHCNDPQSPTTKGAPDGRERPFHHARPKGHDQTRAARTNYRVHNVATARPPRAPPAALALDGKKLAAFSATAGRLLRFPIGDRRCNETRASASKRPGTRAQALQTRVNSSGVAPASPRAAYRALLERRIGRPPKKVGRIFGPRRGLRLPAWPRLGHNFANDVAVSIDERHSPLRFIAAERLRGRVKRRARGGLGRVGFLWEFTPSRSTEKSWPHFRPSAPQDRRGPQASQGARHSLRSSPQDDSASAPGSAAGIYALALDRKKLAAFSALGGD